MYLALLYQFTTYFNNDFVLNQSPKLWFAFCQQKTASDKLAACTGFPWSDPPSSHLHQVSVIRAAIQDHRTQKEASPCKSRGSIVPSLTLGSKQTNRRAHRAGPVLPQKNCDYNFKLPLKGSLLWQRQSERETEICDIRRGRSHRGKDGNWKSSRLWVPITCMQHKPNHGAD